MKFLFIFMTSILSLVSCTSQLGPLGEATIDISDFDFSTHISTILPDRYKDTEFEGSIYLIPQSGNENTNLYRCDTVLQWDSNEPKWVQYNRLSTSWTDEYIRFERQIFNAANFITTLDGRIVLVSGYAHSISEAESNILIARISKLYGQPEITKQSSFRKKYDLHTWDMADRTIKYAAISTDESNVLKLEIERNDQGELTDMREGRREARLQGYIYVIDGPWVEKICNANQASGDLVYCD